MTAGSIATEPLVTADLTPPRLSEVVLRTSRYDEMKAWYQQVLGVKPFFEHTPPDWDKQRAQLTERLPTDLRLCFMRIASGYPFGQVVALFDYPGQQPSLQASGLHHMQLRYASLEDLFTRFERLASIGVQPYKSFNHGPATAFYYQDVDSNMVELSAANFATEQEFVAFMRSPAYAANPAGHAVDPAELVRRWRAGEPAADIVQTAPQMAATQRRTIPVIVVGAGPVGLALGNELGWRGIPCLVVERSTELVDFPTCESINARTLEHMRRWGMADAMRDAGFPPDMPRNVRFMTRVLGHELLCFERPSNRDFQQTLGHVTPEGGIWSPRMMFEPVMRRQLADYPQVQLAQGQEVTRFVQDADGVDVDLRDLRTGQLTQWRCDYLVACDGAASGTRKALGIAMAGTFAEGHNVTVYFESSALAARLADKPGVMMDIVNAEGRANLSSVDGRDRWRLTVHAMAQKPIDAERLVRDALGQALDFTIIGAKPWDGHRVVAERYRDRRVFLAGDAAHLLWPRGGFGMNTGVGDVVDLGWKIEAVLAGWGGEQLLDTYETERRPVAARNVDEAASNRAEDAGLPVPPDIEADTPAGAQARRRLAEVIRQRRAKEWNSLGIQLGYTYDHSPLCVSDGTPALPESASDYVPNTRPGARAPHAWLKNGGSTLDLFGRGFVLLTFGADPAMVLPWVDAARTRGFPLQTIAIDDAAVAQLYERRMVLVRPDGHIAWRADQAPPDAGAVIDQVRGCAVNAA